MGTVFGQIEINHHTFITHLPHWALYLNKSKSINTHSLYIRYTFATSGLELDKSKSLINSLHLNLYNIYSLHIRHIGHCIWTNQNQSSHIHYTFATLGSVFGQIKINHYTFVTHSPYWALYWTNRHSFRFVYPPDFTFAIHSNLYSNKFYFHYIFVTHSVSGAPVI